MTDANFEENKTCWIQGVFTNSAACKSHYIKSISTSLWLDWYILYKWLARLPKQSSDTQPHLTFSWNLKLALVIRLSQEDQKYGILPLYLRILEQNEQNVYKKEAITWQ